VRADCSLVLAASTPHTTTPISKLVVVEGDGGRRVGVEILKHRGRMRG
jgi:hypothetical protein